MKTASRRAFLITTAAFLAAGLVWTHGNRSRQSGCCCPSVVAMSAFATEASKPAATNAATKPALPRLVDLGADKCIPCKMMAPVLEELTKEY